MAIRLALVAALLMGVVATSSSAQQPQPNMPDMMKMHEQMMAEMNANDARLDALIKEMNAASANARVDAIAAVVTELAQQHKAMHQHMRQMHAQMMGGTGAMGRRGMMRGQ
jgi:dihydroorotate dehydrogenase